MIAVGTHDGSLEATVDRVTVEGVVRESTYLWGVFRSHGEQPDIISAMRRLSDGPAWPSRVLLQSNVGAAGVRRHATQLTAARSVDAVVSGVPGAPSFVAAAVDGAESFELAIVDNAVRWSEGALLDVSGTEVGPGLQWWLPPADGRSGMRYASRIFRVEGSAVGVSVAGFIGCDEVHLAAGHQNYVDDPITVAHLSDAWCTWAAAYDDGSVEAGHAAFGPNGFGFGLRSTDGAASVTTAVSGSVTRDAAGCPSHIAFDLAGEPWEFVVDRRGAALESLPGPVRQAEGWFRRVGETRRPVVWCATPEVPAPVPAGEP